MADNSVRIEYPSISIMECYELAEELRDVLVDVRDLLKSKVSTPTVVNVTVKGPVSHEDQQRIVREINRVTELTRHIPNAY